MSQRQNLHVEITNSIFLRLEDKVEFGIQQLYDLVMSQVVPLMMSRIFWNAIMLGLGVCFILFAAVRFFGWRTVGGLILAAVFGIGTFSVSNWNADSRVNTMANTISNTAINAGVAKAQEAHATQLQLIHANVSVAGTEVQKCVRTVDSHDFCSSNTPWYTHREINVHWVTKKTCTDVKDSKGRKTGETCTETTEREWDDEYTPWFNFIVRYYIVVDTKVKYLDPSYDIANRGEPKGKPQVYLTGWRAPEDIANNIYMGEIPGVYDNRIPTIWTDVRKSAAVGGDAVLATFVGKYFHWLHAEESAQYALYAGHYEQLKQLVKLPGPQGNDIRLKDGYGADIVVKSDLFGNGDGPSLDYHAVTDLVGINPTLLSQLNETAENLQGHAGPNLQASIRWFVVRKSVVDKVGGVVETTQALKAYLADETVWGKFSLPKNEIIELIIVNDNSTCIVGRGMETGMPFDNVLVMQDHRMSIPVDSECIPLNAYNAIGKIDGKYTSKDLAKLTYAYPDLSQAGGATSLLYQKTPGYQSPDPDSDECTTTPPEHHGFVRYQMCTQEYRRSNIVMDQNDANLIANDARKAAEDQTSQLAGIIVLIIGLFALGVQFWGVENNERRY